jgi:hypothetical protein
MVYFMTPSIARLQSFDCENDRFIGKDLAGNNCGPIELLRRYFSVGTEEIHEEKSQNTRRPSRDSNPALSG